MIEVRIVIDELQPGEWYWSVFPVGEPFGWGGGPRRSIRKARRAVRDACLDRYRQDVNVVALTEYRRARWWQ